MENFSNITNSTDLVPDGTCLFSLFPCSIMIIGNLILIGFYATLLGFSAKLISDGAELLLDIGLPAAIIGGVVLPLLGAVPDSAMIIFSGIGGNKDEANEQISVGMGTLAGSTIMLLTLPWLGSLILGRVDIINGTGKDETRSKFTLKSFFSQGVTVHPDVTFSAIIMLITTLPYFIVQGADWHYGPTKQSNFYIYPNSGQPGYIKYSSLAAFILSLVFLFANLLFQVLYSVASKRKENERKKAMKEEMLKRRVIKGLFLSTTKVSEETIQSKSTDEESKPLLTSGTKKFANVWKTHRTVKTEEQQDESNGDHQNGKWKTLLKSSVFLVVGVVLVTIFSDPMVDALTSIASKKNNSFRTTSGKHGQHIPIPVFYISFIVTPICSNASELVSSLIFASKRRKDTSSLTFSQLYGAATMNNTLCLAVFSALVFFRGLEWQFSAEVTVILFVEFTVGLIAIVTGFFYKHTYVLLIGFFVGGLYFISIFLIAMLENFANWK